MGTGIWGYGDGAGYAPGTDLIGYKVEATDGPIGKVDRHTDDVSRSYLVVDTGPWIFGRKVVIPAGVVDRVDTQAGTVHLTCTRDQVKDSPDYEKSGRHEDEPTFVRLIETYYSDPHM
ncbi:PRC-barrel domain containing protein [Streptomyces sp. NBC_00091]|uniref:PRC-barrel domain containing protein n=1 Tax=Streptomyces sp. NBC_00091 TaxID=2975648 RepID=UPI00225A1DF0|nr:PRC-barrel domain containing protein [Streptomyces sp. NBC_00091]MCX5380121.1 PRC-barrel domain containing protein [Streptomyces sp. NBC_00091]